MPAAAPASGVWAVGDIHGCSDLLSMLVEEIARHGLPSDGSPPMVIFLGDYVDRGADVSGCLDRLIALQDDPRFQCRFLRGNHESMMLQSLQDSRCGPAWLAMGGLSTLRSYGVEPPSLEASPAAWRAMVSALEAALPPVHLAFMNALELSVSVGDYFFAHAGVDPRRPLNRQRPEDLLWMREPFVGASERLEKVIVHGHTITEEPHVDERRIGVDTGAYRTGVLTAVGLSGTARHFVHARRTAAEASAVDRPPHPPSSLQPAGVDE